MAGSVLIHGGNEKARWERLLEILKVKGDLRSKILKDPDFLLVQKEKDKKSIGVSQAKRIKDFLKEKPLVGKLKVVIIEDAHLLTVEAQNSLLKVLEEPPFYGLVVLLASKKGLLLDTVLSRCQQIALPFASDKQQGSTNLNLEAMSFEELFNLADVYSRKEKEDVLFFLEELLRYDIKNNLSFDLIKKTHQVLKDLSSYNVSVRFALEYLFLLHKFY